MKWRLEILNSTATAHTQIHQKREFNLFIIGIYLRLFNMPIYLLVHSTLKPSVYIIAATEANNGAIVGRLILTTPRYARKIQLLKNVPEMH